MTCMYHTLRVDRLGEREEGGMYHVIKSGSFR